QMFYFRPRWLIFPILLYKRVWKRGIYDMNFSSPGVPGSRYTKKKQCRWVRLIWFNASDEG
ncbi:hypothetical protein, partial [Thiolapillus sp.]|uniref:hypothetical protein n=1 Tax=Thiolapillus sp. TaxID=2017437 RepID=UPI003AF4BB9F